MKKTIVVAVAQWARCTVVPLGEGRQLARPPEPVDAGKQASPETGKLDEANDTSKTLIKLPGLLNSHYHQ